MEIRLAEKRDLIKAVLLDSHIPAEKLAESLEKCRVYLLESSEGKIEGILRFSFFWQTIPFLDLIYLNENYRNRGYGTLMMDKWENDMKLMGYKYVMTSTQEDETAYKFYEKRGYVLKGGFYPPEQEAKELIYIKEL